MTEKLLSASGCDLDYLALWVFFIQILVYYYFVAFYKITIETLIKIIIIPV